MSQEALNTVKTLLREVIGDEFDDLGEITLETRFGEDLELESIEFVALAERLQEVYGASVPFVEWLSTMDLDQIIALRVGDLVEYIEKCLSSK